MKKCQLVKATIWNETAFTLAHAITDIKPDADGFHFYLDVDSLNFGIYSQPHYSDYAFSEKCYYEHSPQLKVFQEMLVIP